jgi:hypothetical protein
MTSAVSLSRPARNLMFVRDRYRKRHEVYGACESSDHYFRFRGRCWNSAYTRSCWVPLLPKFLASVTAIYDPHHCAHDRIRALSFVSSVRSIALNVLAFFDAQ